MEDHLDGRPAEMSERLDDEARREVLKTFGRYAAAAPTAMILLAPGEGQAGIRRRLLRARRRRRGGYD